MAYPPVNRVQNPPPPEDDRLELTGDPLLDIEVKFLRTARGDDPEAFGVLGEFLLPSAMTWPRDLGVGGRRPSTFHNFFIFHNFLDF